MKPQKPYLLRAVYEWIVDSDCTPYLLVDALQPNVQVPEAYVENGRIVLNVSPGAVRHWLLGDDSINFSARFGGQPHTVAVPIGAVLGLYARENGQGMLFEAEAPSPGDDEPPPEPAPEPPRKPALRVVK